MDHSKPDQEYLDAAIKQVTGMLSKKKTIWANQGEAFENFDIMYEFGLTAIQFGLAMCKLKLNRLKTRFRSHTTTVHGFIADPDAEDSLVDLASYALLTLGILKREKARSLLDEDEPSLSLEDLTLEDMPSQAEVIGDAPASMPPVCDIQGNPLHQFCPDDHCKYGAVPVPPDHPWLEQYSEDSLEESKSA